MLWPGRAHTLPAGPDAALAVKSEAPFKNGRSHPRASGSEPSTVWRVRLSCSGESGPSAARSQPWLGAYALSSTRRGGQSRRKRRTNSRMRTGGRPTPAPGGSGPARGPAGDHPPGTATQAEPQRRTLQRRCLVQDHSTSGPIEIGRGCGKVYTCVRGGTLSQV